MKDSTNEKALLDEQSAEISDSPKNALLKFAQV